MSDRANQLITDILRRIHEAIVENDVTYEEYQAAKQWFIDVGEAGEWPLFGDVYIEHVVEEQAFGNREGSQGTILGPFHLPGRAAARRAVRAAAPPRRARRPHARLGPRDRRRRQRRWPTPTSTSGRPTPRAATRASCPARRRATCAARSAPTPTAATSTSP